MHLAEELQHPEVMLRLFEKLYKQPGDSKLHTVLRAYSLFEDKQVCLEIAKNLLLNRPELRTKPNAYGEQPGSLARKNFGDLSKAFVDLFDVPVPGLPGYIVSMAARQVPARVSPPFPARGCQAPISPARSPRLCAHVPLTARPLPRSASPLR